MLSIAKTNLPHFDFSNLNTKRDYQGSKCHYNVGSEFVADEFLQ